MLVLRKFYLYHWCGVQEIADPTWSQACIYYSFALIWSLQIQILFVIGFNDRARKNTSRTCNQSRFLFHLYNFVRHPRVQSRFLFIFEFCRTPAKRLATLFATRRQLSSSNLMEIGVKGWKLFHYYSFHICFLIKSSCLNETTGHTLVSFWCFLMQLFVYIKDFCFMLTARVLHVAKRPWKLLSCSVIILSSRSIGTSFSVHPRLSLDKMPRWFKPFMLKKQYIKRLLLFNG